MKKTQLSIYLDPEIFAGLEAYAARQDKPKSLVAEAASASFLSPDDSDRREAASEKLVRVRVLSSKKALTTTLPRSAGTFFTLRVETSLKLDAVSRTRLFHVEQV